MGGKGTEENAGRKENREGRGEKKEAEGEGARERKLVCEKGGGGEKGRADPGQSARLGGEPGGPGWRQGCGQSAPAPSGDLYLLV